MPRYEVVLSDDALDSYLAIQSVDDERKTDAVLDLLQDAPTVGFVYRPYYPTTRPKQDVLVMHAGHYGIYYTVNEAEKRVEIAFICDQRRDPLRRFEPRR